MERTDSESLFGEIALNREVLCLMIKCALPLLRIHVVGVAYTEDSKVLDMIFLKFPSLCGSCIQGGRGE